MLVLSSLLAALVGAAAAEWAEPAELAELAEPRPEDMWPVREPQAPLAPEVQLAAGSVRGSVLNIGSGRTSFGYEGVPFAEPPVGNLRFLPPVKKGPFGKLNTTQLQRACPQSGILGPGDEDCLYLNVFTTQLPNSTYNPKMPVMVFIYGGAFVSGGSSLYFPNHLQKYRDMVLVVIHYRLGILGFFTTMTDDAPGNLGLMDQILALEWVQENIEQFGGDKDQVTIFGESAGGASVSLLLTSPLAAGLFHRAIAESGSAMVDWAYNEDPLTTGRQIAEMANCQFEPFDKLLQCMRAIPAKQLVQISDDFVAAERSVARNGFDGLNPVIQPASLTTPRVLPKDPVTAFKDGTYMKVPTIHGCNRNEGSFVFGLMYNDFMKVNNLTNDTNFLKNECVATMLNAFHIVDPTDGVTKSMSDQYFFYVDSWDVNTMYPGLEDLTGLFGMKAGAKKMADLLVEDGNPTWMYSFQYRGQRQHTMARLFFMGDDKLPFDTGVTHADELIYLFPIPLMGNLNAEETQVSDMMVQLWTNFAFEGNPTPAGSGLPHWPTVGEDGAYLEITTVPTVKRDFTQTFDISVQEFINSTVTTAAPATTSTPAATSSTPPATSTESLCQQQLESVTDERDTFRGATVGLGVVIGLAAVLVVAAAAVLVTRSRRRGQVQAGSTDKLRI